ncbi:MAG: ATP-binding protein [Parvibaculum sp.]
MDRVKNPYVPGAGTPPPELAGRAAILEEANVALSRVRAARPSQSLILVGLRGVGKTVLLVRMREMAEENGYRAVSVEAHEGKSLAALLTPGLRQILFSLDRIENAKDMAKLGLRVLKSFVGSLSIRINDVERASENAIRILDESFFRVRFDRCTPSEKRYMRALAELGGGSHRSGDIADALGVKVTSVGPTRSTLIKKGMIYSPQHGDTAFTVPLFDSYMRRVMP